MPRVTPDPSFYPTAGEAATAAPEQLAYMAGSWAGSRRRTWATSSTTTNDKE